MQLLSMVLYYKHLTAIDRFLAASALGKLLLRLLKQVLTESDLDCRHSGPPSAMNTVVMYNHVIFGDLMVNGLSRRKKTRNR